MTYTYEPASNRIKRYPVLASATYNANNQQTAFGTTTETYDLNGNLATVTDAGGTTTYTWNACNQLIGISGPSLTASFTYDSLGRRTSKTINGTTTNFLYDGLNPLQEKDGGTVTANLLTGLGIDEFFTRTDGVGSRALLPDALGSTVALGDGTGTLQTQYTYEPFGMTTQTGSASTNSYKYTAREDDGTGLYYYRTRYYQPRLQRFLSEDPIGLAGRDVNLYAYVFNSPINLMDPSGEAVIAPMPPECKPGSGRKNDGLLKGFFQRFMCDPSNMIPGPGIVTGPTKGMLKYFEQQLAQHGKQSLEKSLKSLEKRLAVHLEKLPNLKYPSSVEREIRNFEAQIEAIRQSLRGQP